MDNNVRNYINILSPLVDSIFQESFSNNIDKILTEINYLNTKSTAFFNSTAVFR